MEPFEMSQFPFTQNVVEARMSLRATSGLRESYIATYRRPKSLTRKPLFLSNSFLQVLTSVSL